MFLVLWMFLGQKSTKHQYWRRPSVVVHGMRSNRPMSETSWTLDRPRPVNLCDLRWTINELVWLRRRRRSPASRLRWTSAVQCCQADGSSPRWEFVSHECDRFFSDNTVGKPSSRTNCVEDRPRFSHAFPRAWRWGALSQLWIWCDWCEVPRFKAATLANKGEASACIETVSLILWLAVHLASRAQSLSSFLTRLELRMFELRLRVLHETCWSQRACLRSLLRSHWYRTTRLEKFGLW